MLLVSERLPKTMHRSLGHLANQFLDGIGVNSSRGKPAGAVDIRMRHGPAWVGLKGEGLGDPPLAEIGDKRVEIALGGVGKGVKKAVCAFEHGTRADKAVLCQEGRAQP